MRYLATAGVVAVVVIPALLAVGHRFVPGVGGEGDALFSDTFLFSAFLIFVGFAATTAVIGPVVAQFVEWRENAQWAAARRNARDRLGQALATSVNAYRTVLDLLASKDGGRHAEFFLDQTVVALDNFFETYATEQVSFNAGMHSAASEIRSALAPLHRSLASTRFMARRRRSYRAYLHPDALDKLRALMGQGPLEASGLLPSDPYFAEHGELFIDLALDRRLGAGSISLHRFVPLDGQRLAADWARLCAASGRDPASAAPIGDLGYDADSQMRLHAALVRAAVEEEYLVQALVHPSLVHEG